MTLRQIDLGALYSGKPALPGNGLRDMLWQDKDVRLDCSKEQLRLRNGEILLEKLDSIEDTKANTGERGTLYVTNLRLIWISLQLTRVNISLGYNCISNVSVRTTISKMRGSVESLYIYAKCSTARFEFIFSSLIPGSAKLYAVVNSVFRSYDSSRLYREVKLRGAVIEGSSLKLLPDEQLFDSIEGVFNLTSDTGVLGGMHITNVRLVWYSAINDNYNISIPFLAVKLIRPNQTKYGPAVVLETYADGATCNLGFRIDPPEKLQATMLKIQNLHRLFAKSPIFGLKELKTDQLNAQSLNDVLKAPSEHLEPDNTPKNDALALYYLDNGKGQRRIIFSREIGLAIEEPPNGMTLADLWNPL
ncbi:Bardet-Biedl syndrome 5 protein homolog isoform X2 [Paramacrobiotus metropolitanus]|uniref:Bardet-Biedl syndrome 5 protein homolog isoform X2 n=1 Tax=Paramacrobiotus metropolitanus TaxID=2943436 RepID=UPI002445AC19|nr:Bardet-Biedl syndrome 5 protein homolog isoform X2 [Paramacrobiotus metropolitanus]